MSKSASRRGSDADPSALELTSPDARGVSAQESKRPWIEDPDYDTEEFRTYISRKCFRLLGNEP